MKIYTFLKKVVAVCSFVFLLTAICYSQIADVSVQRYSKYNIQPPLSINTIKLIDAIDESSPSGNHIEVSLYDFDGLKVKMYEEYFKSERTMEERLTEKLSQWQSCSSGKNSKIKDETARGNIYRCVSEHNGVKSAAIIYTLVDGINKITDIEASDIETAENFTKHIHPISCHIHGLGCP